MEDITLKENTNPRLNSNLLDVKKDTINGQVFIKEYWVVYGGQNHWDAIINTYTKQNNSYYVISLVHNFLSDISIDGLGSSLSMRKKIALKILNEMHNSANSYVSEYSNIVSSFAINQNK